MSIVDQPTRALLALQDGSLFEGYAFGAGGSAVGEVIFNTSISGYQEIITDPSYARQIITFTHPQIGNVGANSNDVEAETVHASAVVIKSLPCRISNWRAESSIEEFLTQKKIVGIHGIDTRRLTRLIRSKGAQNGCVTSDPQMGAECAVRMARDFPGLKGMDLAKEVSTRSIYQWRDGIFDLDAGTARPISDNPERLSVVAYDFGIKHNILRMLCSRGCDVSVVPAQTPCDVLGEDVDGVFLSNGPGDPEPCTYAIDTISEIMKRQVPIFGICLGHQLLALAAGGRTMKMKFGHHGANHPVRVLTTGEIMITSQNHGFAVDDAHLPDDVAVTHRSLFDGSIQGLKHKIYPAFSFQGHPEASPGPHDCSVLFDQFIAMMRKSKKNCAVGSNRA